MKYNTKIRFKLDIQFFAGSEVVVYIDNVKYTIRSSGTIFVLENGLQSDNGHSPFWIATNVSETRVFAGVSSLDEPDPDFVEYAVGSHITIDLVSSENYFNSRYSNIYSNILNRSKIISKIQTDSSNVFDIVPNKMANASGNYYAELPTLTQNETIATGTQLATKQDTLVSGTNIKTINGQNILGSGNITIEGGGTDYKALYHLGAFDTVDTSNTDYDLVTRATGYVILSKLNYSVASSGKFYSGGVLDTIAKNTDYKRIKFARLTIQNVGSLDYLDDMSMSIDTSGYIQIRNDSCNSDVNSLKAFLENDVAEYQLQTPYTEKVIKNQPLNTLDQNGCAFVRNEWEKGLNLLNVELFTTANTQAIASLSYSVSSDGGLTLVVNDANDPYVYFKNCFTLTKTTTITMSLDNYTNIQMFGIVTNETTGFISYAANTPLTITLPAGIYGIGIELLQIETSTHYIMLNEGNHAYPYQSYNANKHISNEEAKLLRDEYEKGLNLWDGTKRNGYYYSVNGTYQEVSGQYCTYLIKVKPNTTYTVDIPASVHAYNSSGTWLGMIVDGASSATTFTTPANTDTIGINMGTYTQIMLVEGSHAYPYQPYNGEIVHQKELETKQDTLISGMNIKMINNQSILGSGDITLTKSSVGLGNVDNTSDLNKPISTATQAALDELEAEMDEAPVKVLDYSMSKVSGISDGLALPKQSQMEMLSLRGNTVAWNQMVDHASFITSNYYGLTITANENTGVFTIKGTPTASPVIIGFARPIKNHYMLLLYKELKNNTNSHLTQNAMNAITAPYIDHHTNSDVNAYYLAFTPSDGEVDIEIRLFIIDLTIAYPTDTPTTVSDPRVQWCINYALQHPEFASKLVNVGLSAYETTGRNLLSGQTVTNNYGDTGLLIGICGTSGIYTFNANETVDKINIDEIEENGTSLGTAASVENNSVLSATLVAGKRYGVWCYKNSNWSYGVLIKDKLMMNYGSTALPYEPYVKHTYPCLWNGKSAGSVQDEKLANGKEITRTVLVDLGSLTWTYDSTYGAWYSNEQSAIKPVTSNNVVASITSSNYVADSVANIIGQSKTINTIGANNVVRPNIWVYNGSSTTTPSGYACFELVTPTETDSDPLPNAIAVYQGGTEWQINDGAPCGIYKDYDISIKDQVLTNVKVDARQEEEIGELKQADLKTLYNLGEFDTLDTSNSEYDLITRNGWHFNLSKFVLDNASSAYFRSSVGGYQLSPLGQDQLIFPSAYIESGGTPVFADNSVFVPTSANGCYGNSSGFVISHQYISLPSSYNTKQAYLDYFSQNEIIIQYELATPYTEKVIKNRPLDTLDQNGSMFVRKEWEKGLNLYSGPQNITAEQYVKIPNLKPNTTYTISTSATLGAWVILLDSNTSVGSGADTKPITFTTESTADNTRFYFNTTNASYNIMVVEGSHPYPYQPYNGDIVREKDANGTLLWENGNPDASFGAQTITLSESLFNFKYLIICSKLFYEQEVLRIDKFKVLSVSYAPMAISMVASDGGVMVRFITVDTVTTLNVGECYQNGVGGDDEHMCPIAIYGTNVL